MRRRLGAILAELKAHAPFTLFGLLDRHRDDALVFQASPKSTAYRLFYVFHPLHVALVGRSWPASIFRLHEKSQSFLSRVCWSATSLGGHRHAEQLHHPVLRRELSSA